jgi:ribosomal protein L11 methyltransferase
MTWWKIEIEVPSELSEPLSYLMSEASGQVVEVRDSTTLSRPETETGAPDPNVAHLVIGLDHEPDETLRTALVEVLGDFGLDADAIRTQRSDDETWREGWKAFLRGGRLSARIWVRPPWEVPAPDAEVTLVIDPGMAFGTGQHETTRGVMQILDDVLRANPGDAVLDVGTGSGILAIGAALLGSEALGVDNDPEAFDNARDNVALNACEERVAIRIGSLESVERRYPVVVANILARTLIELAEPLSERCTRDLVLAGLLHADADAVCAAFPDFERVRHLRDGEWSILHLVRKGA